MHDDTHALYGASISSFLLACPFVLALIGYIYGVIQSNRQYREWPISRMFFFLSGILTALIAVVGPLAHQAHFNFTAHMFAHLLLGMLSPILLVLARPMTLIFRTLSVPSARCLSRILMNRVVRTMSDPLLASVFNIGGLWLLYTTPLYSIMQESIILHLFVHIHLFIAGYMSTISMIYFDPTPHRTRFLYRGIIMVLALAGHEILSKYIYSHPPDGVPSEQAQAGGLLMFYGGDAIELVLIILFFYQWFRSTKPISATQIRPVR